MAVTANHLETDINIANQTSYDTGSISPAANQLILISIINHNSVGASNVPTVTGCGVTWVFVNTTAFAADDKYRATVLRAMGTPSSGVLTIDFNAETQTRCGWSVNEFDSVDTGGTNGSAAVVQSDTNSGAGILDLTVSLAAFGDAGNATYGAFCINNDRDVVPDGSFIELGQALDGTENVGIQTQWYNAPDTTVKASWSSSLACGAVGIEIKAAVANLAAIITRRPNPLLRM